MTNRILLSLIAANVVICAVIAGATFDGSAGSVVGWIEAVVGWVALAACKTNEIVSGQ